jgi:predicted nucleotidyltransferase
MLERSAIRRICVELGVERLWLFGSAVRDDFVPGESGYDFLVEWTSRASRGQWASEIGELGARLKEVLGGGVDVTEATARRNAYLDAAIEAEKVLVYDAA